MQNSLTIRKKPEATPFVTNLEAATGEPLYMTVLGLAGEGLIKLPEWARQEAAEALDAVSQAEVRKLSAGDKAERAAAQARFAAQRKRRKAARDERDAMVRDAFRRFVRAEGYKGLSYRQMSEALGGLRSPATLYRWMTKDFPEVAAKVALRQN